MSPPSPTPASPPGPSCVPPGPSCVTPPSPFLCHPSGPRCVPLGGSPSCPLVLDAGRAAPPAGWVRFLPPRWVTLSDPRCPPAGAALAARPPRPAPAARAHLAPSISVNPCPCGQQGGGIPVPVFAPLLMWLRNDRARGWGLFSCPTKLSFPPLAGLLAKLTPALPR